MCRQSRRSWTADEAEFPVETGSMVCLDHLADPTAHLNLEQMHPDTRIVRKMGQMAFRQLVPAQVFIVILYSFYFLIQFRTESKADPTTLTHTVSR